MNRIAMWSLIAMLFGATPLSAQTCISDYVGPPAGGAKVLATGGVLAAYSETRRIAHVAVVSVAVLSYRGETNENTAAFRLDRKQRTIVAGEPPTSDENTSTPISVRWEGRPVPINVPWATIHVVRTKGRTVGVVLDHAPDSPNEGPC